MENRAARVAVVILAVLAQWGCAEDGIGMAVCGDRLVDNFNGEECDDGNLAPGDGCSATCTSESPSLILPTLDSIQTKVFMSVCVACHSPGGTGTWMPLETPDAAYQSLVVTNEVVVCYTRRVVPGDPDGSCLIRKIEGSWQDGGGPMPPWPATPLTPEQIAPIREWIQTGAPR
jgi:cysteine-rich repeat protein